MTTSDEMSPASAEPSGPAAIVLVVDDEVAVRQFAVRVLQRYGYSCSEAGDGAEALELIRAQPLVFAVVVSDVVMPRLNGVELLQTLAQAHPDLPVILMSGYASAALAELGITPPCAILAKPFPPESLLAEVQRCIRRPNPGVKISSA